jgi:GT2 family glycosyltransferase
MNMISFITVDYNGLNDTIELIESIHNIVHSVPYEIIVVDNASRNDDAEEIRKRFPDIVVLRSLKNLGFAGGNNLGLKYATGEYLFFINNDTYIEEDHFDELIQLFEKYSDIGGISPKIRYSVEPHNIQYAGFTPMSKITLRNSTIGYGEIDNGQYDKAYPTSFLHGAAMLIKREVIENVGIMSEDYFLYYEEMDWCCRIKDSGYELWYNPIQTIFHKESQSTGKFSSLHLFYLTRNRLLYAYRNSKGTTRFLSILYLTTISALKNIVSFAFKGQFSSIKTLVKAIIAYYKLER